MSDTTSTIKLLILQFLPHRNQGKMAPNITGNLYINPLSIFVNYEARAGFLKNLLDVLPSFVVPVLNNIDFDSNFFKEILLNLLLPLFSNVFFKV